MGIDMAYGTGHYPYAKLERALGAALYAGAKPGALRGRLKRLLTLGLPAPQPDRPSHRRQYSLEEAHQLLIAIMLEDAGLDPLVAAAAVIKLWESNMRKLAESAADAPADNPIILEMTVCIVTGPWRTGDPNSALPYVRLTPRVNERALRRYRQQGMSEAEALLHADEVHLAANRLREEEGWLAVRNFSAKAKKLEKVLDGKEV